MESNCFYEVILMTQGASNINSNKETRTSDIGTGTWQTQDGGVRLSDDGLPGPLFNTD
jgi:hypothetical protein